MDPICLYFARTTVNEEGAYFPASREFFDRLATDGPQVEQVREVLYVCKSIYGIDLFDVMRNDYDPNVFYVGRPFQTAMFVAVAHFLEAALGCKVSAAGFYSAGAGPAFIVGGVFSLATYFSEVVPFQLAVRGGMIETGERYPLWEILLEGAPQDDIEAYISSLIAERGLSRRVFIKDRRLPYLLHLAGYKDELGEALEQIWQRFPKSRGPAHNLQKALGSHLLLYDRAPVDRLLETVAFNPPRFDMIGIRGEFVAQGCADQDVLRRLYADANQDRMNTGAAFRALAESRRQIVVIGTPLGAKPLKRLAAAGGYGEPKMAQELIMQRQSVPSLA